MDSRFALFECQQREQMLLQLLDRVLWMLATLLMDDGTLPSADECARLTPSFCRALVRSVASRARVVDEQDERSDGVLVGGLQAIYWTASALNGGLSTGGSSNAMVEALFKEPNGVSLGFYMIKALNRETDARLIRGCLALFDLLVASTETASFFYATDMRVLVEIAVREVADRPIDDALVPWYLSVLFGIVQHSAAFASEPHRVGAIQSLVASLAALPPSQSNPLAIGLAHDIANSLSVFVDDGDDDDNA
jgi:SPIN90/Ldb17, leucine-rich domain